MLSGGMLLFTSCPLMVGKILAHVDYLDESKSLILAPRSSG
jgi:hypothetical protein